MPTLKFEVTYQDADLIVACLAKAPYEVTYKLIEELKKQSEPQLKQSEPEKQDE